MTVINKTPHTVTILDDGKVVREYQSDGSTIRLAMSEKSVGLVDGVPLVTVEYGEPVGLPPEQEGVTYIVSALVRQALPERRDLVVPAGLVRDENGRIIGCERFAC